MHKKLLVRVKNRKQFFYMSERLIELIEQKQTRFSFFSFSFFFFNEKRKKYPFVTI